MKRIAILTDNAFTYTGREAVCSFMTKVYSNKNEVDIISLSGEGEPFHDFSGAKLIKTFLGKSYPLYSALRFMKKKEYDYIFTVSMGKLSVLTSIYKFLFLWSKSTRFIACEHISYNSLKKPQKIIKSVLLRNFHKVVVLTDIDRDIYTKHNVNVIKIENPLNYKNITRTKRYYNILAVGRLSSQKNFAELLDIWSEFKKNDDKYKLTILGDGDERQILEQKILSLGLNDSVELKGKVNNINFYYELSDICLMTSKYEGLPMVLLEAKSWSIPSIAYDCPTGPKEIIVDNFDGFVIEQYNRKKYLEMLFTLTRNDDVFFRMTNNTKASSARFSSDKISLQWNKLIRG
ncbi:glycosyltransferase [Rosenbergiella collisarenosi]|uniref:glycosyltransferase n=1 Tax=Rosenbergiella collisarenosi TaxID=1544695 RepID=UPI001F4F3B6D|nr:glycosyltransferase [Rosenbergiella collisarenosi]